MTGSDHKVLKRVTGAAPYVASLGDRWLIRIDEELICRGRVSVCGWNELALPTSTFLRHVPTVSGKEKYHLPARKRAFLAAPCTPRDVPVRCAIENKLSLFKPKKLCFVLFDWIRTSGTRGDGPTLDRHAQYFWSMPTQHLNTTTRR